MSDTEPKTRECPYCVASERKEVKLGEWRFDCNCFEIEPLETSNADAEGVFKQS